MSSMYRVIVIVDQKNLAALVKSISARGYQIRIDPVDTGAKSAFASGSWGGPRPGAGRKAKVTK